jgi:hypothetical protein
MYPAVLVHSAKKLSPIQNTVACCGVYSICFKCTMENWQSYYANYPSYPPCLPPYPCPPRDQSSYPPLLPECSLSGASHLRVSDTDSDSGSPSRDLRRPNQYILQQASTQPQAVVMTILENQQWRCLNLR